MSYVMRECNSYIYYLLSYIIMWYKFKMLAVSRGVHPAQVGTSGNPANVSRTETARKNAEKRLNCLSIIHNSLYLFVKQKFCEKMGKAERRKTA